MKTGTHSLFHRKQYAVFFTKIERVGSENLLDPQNLVKLELQSDIFVIFDKFFD